MLSCMKQLPCNLQTVTNKMWSMKHDTPVPFTQSQETSSKDKTQNVLSVTFTRALCKNVKKRLRKANVDLPSIVEPDPSVCSADAEYIGAMKPEDIEFYFHEYLSEVCVKTEPLDIVLKPELLGVFSSLIAGLSRGGKSAKVHPINVKNAELKQSHIKEDRSSFESSSVHNLPLIYADLGTVRLFVPKSKKMQALSQFSQSTAEKSGTASAVSHQEHRKISTELLPSTVINIEMDLPLSEGAAKLSQPLSSSKNIELSKIQTAQPVSAGAMFHSSIVMAKQPDKEHDVEMNDKEDRQSKSASEVCSTLFHDMIVLQVNSCLLQPYADNPLPRWVMFCN